MYLPLKLKVPPSISGIDVIGLDPLRFEAPNLNVCVPLIQLVSFLIWRFCPLDQTGWKLPAPRLLKPDMLMVGYVTFRVDGGACRPIFAFTFPRASASGEKLIKNSSLNHPTFVVVTRARRNDRGPRKARAVALHIGYARIAAECGRRQAGGRRYVVRLAVEDPGELVFLRDLIILARVDSADVLLVGRIEMKFCERLAVLWALDRKSMSCFAIGSIRFAGMMLPGNTWRVFVVAL